MRTIPALVLALVACASPLAATAQPADAKKLRDVLSGDAKGAASANARCRLFTPAEIKGFLGASVGAGENAAGGAGCMWKGDTGTNALVTVVEARYASPPSGMKGFKKLPAIAPKAWVAPDMGWSAGTIDGDSAVVVNLGGTTATEAKVVAFLEEALKRNRR